MGTAHRTSPAVQRVRLHRVGHVRVNSLIHRALWLGCLVGFVAAIVSMFVLHEELDAADVFPDHHP